MANTKSAIKRIRTSQKRQERNVAVKSSTRTFVKKARQAVAADPGTAKDDIIAAISALDRAARKGIVHPNNAARRKSRLMKRFHAAEAELASAATEAKAVAPKTRRRTVSKAKTSSGAGKKAAKPAVAAKKTAKSAVATAPEGAKDAAEKPKRATRVRKRKAE